MGAWLITWLTLAIYAFVVLGVCILVVIRLRKPMREVAEKSLELSVKNRELFEQQLQLNKEMLIAQKETNELLKQLIQR